MDRNKIIVKKSMLGIVVNILLVIFKSIIGIIANSIAIILDAINNLTDVLSALITIIGTKLSNKAPDKEHPYGHGRIEYFTSVIISTIIFLAGIIASKESIEKIIHPAETDYTLVSLIIIAVAVCVKYVLGGHLKKVGRSINSRKSNCNRSRCFYGLNFIIYHINCCNIKLYMAPKHRRIFRIYNFSCNY